MARQTAIAVLAAVTLCFSCCSKEKPAPEQTDSAENRIFVSGSAAVTPLLKILAQAFSEKEPDIEVVFPPDSHSKAGVAGAALQKYDIGTLSREMRPGEKDASLEYLHLAIDGLVFVANPNVKVSTLSPDQLRSIYSGQISSWSQLGGPDAKIEVIDRPEHTSAKLALRGAYLGEELGVTSEAVVVERPWQVTDSIQMIPYSIGYTSLGEIISGNPSVNIISVGGFDATPMNIKSGHYRFFRPFGLVLAPEQKASTMRFVNFIFSDTGSRIIKNSGYVPLRYEILIGIVPEQNIIAQNRRYKPLVDYLSHRLGEKFSVKLKLFPTYIEVCRSLSRGDINAAFLGSFAYATVRDYVDVIARPDYGGVSTYKGLLFVRVDSDIESLEQMKGKRLVLGGKTTTAGYVFPLYYFRRHGISDYRNYFSESTFVGTHEDAILAVFHNKADVGAAKDHIFRLMAKENPFFEEGVRILASSPPMPSNALVLRKSISLPCFDCHQKQGVGGRGADEQISPELDMKETIKQYLLTMPENPEGRQALMELGNASGFLETTDADYAELYKMLNELHIRPQVFLISE
jgi:phosphate transport system substrate-binding protein